MAFGINVHEIVMTTLRNRESRFVYRDGVVDEAMRRAALAVGNDAIIDAIGSAFKDFEIGPLLLEPYYKEHPFDEWKAA